MAEAPGAEPAWVALGSNLGDRESHLLAALQALAASTGLEVTRASRIWETEPVGPPPQGPYLNAALELRTRLDPHALLARLLEIERARGRTRDGPRNTARTLDLDLLLHGEAGRARLDHPDLVLPHPRLHERPFVLEPLCDLAPDLVHPTIGRTLSDLAAHVRDPKAVRPYNKEVPQWPSPP